MTEKSLFFDEEVNIGYDSISEEKSLASSAIDATPEEIREAFAASRPIDAHALFFNAINRRCVKYVKMLTEFELNTGVNNA